MISSTTARTRARRYTLPCAPCFRSTQPPPPPLPRAAAAAALAAAPAAGAGGEADAAGLTFPPPALPSQLIVVGDLSRILRLGGDGGPGVVVQLAAMLMLLRKASIHPMLTRSAYSTASVLSIAARVYACDYDAAFIPAGKLLLPMWPPASHASGPSTAAGDRMGELAVAVAQPDLAAWSGGIPKLAQLADHLLSMSVRRRG